MNPSLSETTISSWLSPMMSTVVGAGTPIGG
jgi:hypothetical protein